MGSANTAYVCGGSRSRAFAVTGDALETEPDCVYVPGQVPTVFVSSRWQFDLLTALRAHCSVAMYFGLFRGSSS